MPRHSRQVFSDNFQAGAVGGLPDGWELNVPTGWDFDQAPYEWLRPVFKLIRRNSGKALLATGGGNPDCVGWLSRKISLTAGRTYRLRVRFRFSKEINPQMNLIFAVYNGKEFNNGIFKFRKLGPGYAEGDDRFFVPGDGEVDAEARIYFRYSANGRVWFESISLEECDPIEPRYVRVASTCGYTPDNLDNWANVLDAAAADKADLIVLPEWFNSAYPEPPDGPCATLMSSKAREHGMYVAGCFQCKCPQDERVYNECRLYDRSGEAIGIYRKNHPWSPEAHRGVTPGTEMPVIVTDFGKVGMIICYDNWFTDVSELLALKGAEIILFSCGGYNAKVVPARAIDNGVRYVVGTGCVGAGIWDSAGVEVTHPDGAYLHFNGAAPSFDNVKKTKIGEIELLSATFDLSQTPSPDPWGGPLECAPGGRRNRRDQKRLLIDEIKAELTRWWEE